MKKQTKAGGCGSEPRPPFSDKKRLPHRIGAAVPFQIAFNRYDTEKRDGEKSGVYG